MRSQIESLFATSNKVSPTALAAARDQFESIDTTGANRQLAGYAFALVLLEQQKLEEAGTRLDELLKTTPGSLPLRKTRAWIQLMRKEYQPALVTLETLARNIAIGKDGKPTSDQREAARFLGCAVAFLEGPASSPRIEKLVATAKDRVKEKLPAVLTEDFNAGAAATMEQFGKLQGDVSGAKDEVARIQAEAIKTQTEQLESHQTALDEAKEALDKATDEKKKKAQAEAEVLEAQLSELRQSFGEVQGRALPLQTQITTAQAEIQSLTQTVQRENGTIEVIYTDPNRVSFLQNLIARFDAQLAPLRAQMATLNARAADAQGRYNDLARRHNLAMRQIAGEGKTLAANQNRLDRMQKNQAREKPSGNNTKTRTLSSRLTSFTTYEPFPMAQEKSRVLDAIR